MKVVIPEDSMKLSISQKSQPNSCKGKVPLSSIEGRWDTWLVTSLEESGIAFSSRNTMDHLLSPSTYLALHLLLHATRNTYPEFNPTDATKELGDSPKGKQNQDFDLRGSRWGDSRRPAHSLAKQLLQATPPPKGHKPGCFSS